MAPRRIPPQAEKAVIASILMNPDVAPKAVAIVGTQDFMSPIYKTIFSAITDLVGAGKEADVVNIMSWLEEKGLLDQIGGGKALQAILEKANPSSHKVSEYAQTVKERSIMRQVEQAGEMIVEMAQDTAKSVTGLLADAQTLLLPLSNRATTGKFVQLDEVFAKKMEDIAAAARGEMASAIPTGFPKLDALLGGLHKTDIVVLAARPGHGKTAWALNIARNVAAQKKRVAFLSLEMSAQQVGDRLLAAEAEVDSQSIMTGKLREHELERVVKAMGVLANPNLLVDTHGVSSVNELRARVSQVAAESPLDLLIIDYLQLMRGGRGSSRYEEVTYISIALKQLAKDLNIPVIVLSQLNREAASGEPQMHHLRESGQVEQDADVVILLSRVDNDPTKIRLNIAKHRNGPVGGVDMLFRTSVSTFFERE